VAEFYIESWLMKLLISNFGHRDQIRGIDEVRKIFIILLLCRGKSNHGSWKLDRSWKVILYDSSFYGCENLREKSAHLLKIRQWLNGTVILKASRAILLHWLWSQGKQMWREKTGIVQWLGRNDFRPGAYLLPLNTTAWGGYGVPSSKGRTSSREIVYYVRIAPAL
jgi:hypothetical protein